MLQCSEYERWTRLTGFGMFKNVHNSKKFPFRESRFDLFSGTNDGTLSVLLPLRKLVSHSFCGTQNIHNQLVQELFTWRLVIFLVDFN